MSTLEKIKKIIADHLGVEESEITSESHLQDDLNADPLGMADVIVSLEDEFSIKISSEENIKFNTVGDIENFITDQIGEV